MSKESTLDLQVAISSPDAGLTARLQTFLQDEIGVDVVVLRTRDEDVYEELEEDIDESDYAVVVATSSTGADAGGSQIAWEVGYLQGLLGRSGVLLVHQAGLPVAGSLPFVTTAPFENGGIDAVFPVLREELERLAEELEEIDNFEDDENEEPAR